MTPRLLLVAWVGCVLATGGELRYASGLLEHWEASEIPKARQMFQGAAKNFIQNTLNLPNVEVREGIRHSDRNHIHQTYDIFFEGRRVLGRKVRLHYHRSGFIDFASSDLEFSFDLKLPPAEETAQSQAQLEARIREAFESQYGKPFLASLKIEPIIWIDVAWLRPIPAFQVRLNAPQQFHFDHYVVEERTLERLSTQKALRYVDTTGKVYKVSPLTQALASVSISNLTGLDKLLSSLIHVRRDECQTSTGGSCISSSLKDIRADQDYAAASGYSESPASYNFLCKGSDPTSCPNQALDGVNVYYHVNGFRQKLDTYFTELGATPTFPTGALAVIVNVQGTATNNAAYSNSACDVAGTIPRCLFFLRPDTAVSSSCGSGSIQLFDLAREANVAVHEYQHFITDQITGLVPSDTGTPNVGDVIHEGYSDYFGASHVSLESGLDAFEIGKYSFQTCAPVIRNIGTLRPLENSAAEGNDPHVGGHTFASGLWKLRSEFVTEYGATVGIRNLDKLALQSLFYLPTKPGFITVVEALVRADNTLFSGSHVVRIRQVFYDEIKFVGGQSGVFSDSAARVANVGFQSCLSVKGQRYLPGTSWALFFSWLLLTVGLGKRRNERR